MKSKKDIVAFKEFRVNSRGEGRGPVYPDKSWGKLVPGKLLQAKAARNSNDCDKGVHAWKRNHGFNFSGSNQLWQVVIPAGTYFHNGNRKYRADAIRLVKRVSAVS